MKNETIDQIIKDVQNGAPYYHMSRAREIHANPNDIYDHTYIDDKDRIPYKLNYTTRH